MLAVLLYHANYAWLPGGFLGVDVFFVLSGYLITAILLVEWQQHGRVDLRTFWIRRARRLLPAVFLLLAGVLAYAAFFLPEELPGLQLDALAAAGYVTNWWLIFENQSYFEAMGRPSLFQHLWSLAVEEQFYLLWPLVFVVVMRFVPRGLPVFLVGGAAASTLLMAVLFDPHTDPSRVYFGTDTRMAALLVGAALAWCWRPTANGGWAGPRWLPQTRNGEPWPSTRALDGAGFAALAVLTLMFFRVNEFSPFLYQGGFLLAALAAAVAIAAVAHPRARVLPAVLGTTPLRWMGTRSYAIYLWHWPVFMVTRPHLDVPLDGWTLFAVRLAITLALAECSYRFVEMPVRHGGLERAWQRCCTAAATHWGLGRWSVGWMAGSATLLIVLVAGIFTPAPAPGSTTPAFPQAAAAAPTAPADGNPVAVAGLSDSGEAEETQQSPAATPGVATDGATTDGTPTPAPTRAAPEPSPTAAPPAVATPAAPGDSTSTEPPGAEYAAPATPVTAVGDSVMLGAAEAIETAMPGVTIHGQLGLQTDDLLDVLRTLHATGGLTGTVIVQPGTNGILRDDDLEEILALTAGAERVVILTVRVPRAWQEPNNDLMRQAVPGTHAVLLDWYHSSAGQGHYFWDDGVHLTPEGAAAFASLIAAHAAP